MFDPTLIQELEANPLQDPFRVKARIVGLEAAKAIREGRPIPRTGELILDDHLEYVERWARHPDLEARLKKMGPPFAHRGVESLIRLTAGGLDPAMAALVAWCTPLRQTVGSCFATAPCQLIQRLHPERFFDDIVSLYAKGQLIRVMEGREVRVPLALSWGVGELHRPLRGISPGLKRAFEAVGVPAPIKWEGVQTADELLQKTLREAFHVTQERIQFAQQPLHGEVVIQPKSAYDRWLEAYEKAKAVFLSFADCPLLRAWEYTVASLCDVKANFSTWNLYVSLGLHPEERGGLTSVVTQIVTARLEAWNDRIQMLKGAEQERAMRVAEGVSHLVRILVQEWIERFPEAFQEVYDPSIADGIAFEDQPAGFRLVYKGWRGSAATWEPIENREQFVNAVRTFIVQIERDVARRLHFVGAEEELKEVVTAVIQKMQEEAFLEGAMRRAKAHHGPKATPWLYISGGTVETLLQSYFSLAQVPEREVKRVQGVRSLREWVMSKQGGPQLMVSPTHAFLFRPDWMAHGIWADTNWSNWVFAFTRDGHLVRTRGHEYVVMDEWAQGEWAILLA